MRSQKNANMYLPFLIFFLIGSAFVGVEVIQPEPQKIMIDNDCLNYVQDADGDGLSGFIDDDNCQEYPYSDGNGESKTLIVDGGNGESYQNAFDLTVDFVRFFVNTQCMGSLNNCIGTNFQTEVRFYCYFSDNVMSNPFFTVFDSLTNGYNMPDDDSINTLQSTCFSGLPPQYPATMPNNGDQTSTPIPNNPDGDNSAGNGNAPK